MRFPELIGTERLRSQAEGRPRNQHSLETRSTSGGKSALPQIRDGRVSHQAALVDRLDPTYPLRAIRPGELMYRLQGYLEGKTPARIGGNDATCFFQRRRPAMEG